MAAKEKTTRVTLGWVVRKTWVDKDGKPHDRCVSQTFSSQEAARVFEGLAKKSEPEMSFYTTADIGYDHIAGGFDGTKA